MKNLYVFGDSFMTRDEQYPEQHWSEMISDYTVIMRSQSGCSNGMIAHELFRSLSLNPAAVVVGFTAEMRLSFDDTRSDSDRLWYCNGSVDLMTSDQQLACDYYATTVSERMVLIETYMLMRGLFLTLEKYRIPYAWTPMMLDNNLAEPRSNSQDWIDILGDFETTKIPLNLSTYPVFSSSPGFHTHDKDWQTTFVTQAQEIIDQQVEFYKK